VNTTGTVFSFCVTGACVLTNDGEDWIDNFETEDSSMEHTEIIEVADVVTGCSMWVGIDDVTGRGAVVPESVGLLRRKTSGLLDSFLLCALLARLPLCFGVISASVGFVAFDDLVFRGENGVEMVGKPRLLMNEVFSVDDLSTKVCK